MALEIVRVLPFSADVVWGVVGDVGRTDWVPGVVSCELNGEVRRFTMAGAGELAERICRRSEGERFLEYSVIESTPPLDAHLASISLSPEAEGTRFVWRTTVSPVAVEPFIEKAMLASLERLEQILQAEAAQEPASR